MLGLNRSASGEDIRAAYKRLCLQYHPDKNKSDDAAAQFLKVREAYQILGDVKARRDYDALLEVDRGQNAELFNFLMNLLKTQLDVFLKQAEAAKAQQPNKYGAQRQDALPPDINLSIDASLDDLYRGAVRKMQVKVLRENSLTPINIGVSLTDFWEPAIFERAGDNCLADIIVSINPIEHNRILIDRILKTYDLSIELPISLSSLYMGYNHTIDFLAGSELVIERPGGDPSNLMLRLDGYGLPYDGGDNRGALYVFFYLTLPKQVPDTKAVHDILAEYFRREGEHAKIERYRIQS